MRKWIIAFLVLVLILASVYRLIPAKINIHQKTIVPANTKAFTREIEDEQTWKNWWPGKQTQSSTSFEYNGNTYFIKEKKLTSLIIAISKGTDSITTELLFVPLSRDSVELSWNGIDNAGANPVSRVKNYSWVKSVSTDLNFLLKKMQLFYSNEDNIYNLHIQKNIVADSNYVFTSATFTVYPATEAIYKMIDKLKLYVEKNGAKETGFPMLNIFKEQNLYLVKAALPVDKKLDDSGDIKYRWMLKGGNILTAEVRGGSYRIEQAFNQMSIYIEDHDHTAPAIPFQSLITDRRQQLDTNKWITKLYWPVM